MDIEHGNARELLMLLVVKLVTRKAMDGWLEHSQSYDLPELTPRRNAPVCMAKKRVERAAAGSRRPVFIVLFGFKQSLAYSGLFHVPYREFDIFIQACSSRGQIKPKE